MTLRQSIRELMCWHKWDDHIVNVNCADGTTKVITLHFAVCHKCGASKLGFIFSNGRTCI